MFSWNPEWSIYLDTWTEKKSRNAEKGFQSTRVLRVEVGQLELGRKQAPLGMSLPNATNKMGIRATVPSLSWACVQVRIRVPSKLPTRRTIYEVIPKTVAPATHNGAGAGAKQDARVRGSVSHRPETRSWRVTPLVANLASCLLVAPDWATQQWHEGETRKVLQLLDPPHFASTSEQWTFSQTVRGNYEKLSHT